MEKKLKLFRLQCELTKLNAVAKPAKSDFDDVKHAVPAFACSEHCNTMHVNGLRISSVHVIL